MRRGRIVFVNRYFHPDHSATSQLLTDLATDLAAAGEEVLVVASRRRYGRTGDSLRARGVVRGVVVRRCASSGLPRNRSLLLRGLDDVVFLLSAAVRVWREARAGDVVVSLTDPPMLGSVVAPVARMRRAVTMHWLQDLFPEVAVAAGVRALRASAGRVLQRVRDRSLRDADVVAIGAAMRERLVERGVPPVRVHVRENWVDARCVEPIAPRSNRLRARWGLEGRFVVGYSGNMGRAHEPAETLLAAARRLRRPDVAFLVIGGGPGIRTLRSRAGETGGVHWHFEPYQPREVLAESLSAADVHLVTLRPSMEGLVVPSKLYGALAVGRPVIVVGDVNGEVAQLVIANACGVAVESGDGVGLARAIEMLGTDREARRAMGRAGRALVERRFDRPIAIAEWIALIRAVRARGRAGTLRRRSASPE
jgi:glycosyltransferase involved in cell wall biosynthesis